MQSEKSILISLQNLEDDGRDVFIAGNFNQWDVNDASTKMIRTENSHFIFHMPINSSTIFPIEYKFHRGSWSDVETDKNASNLPNRAIPKYRKKVNDKVKRWLNNGHLSDLSFRPVIEVVDEHFPIPFLNKTRRIRIILPYNYYNSNKRYQVIYMNDGQNLWDKNAPFGNWDIESSIKMMSEKNKNDVILVAIDHGERERIEEFNPIQGTRLGRSEGRNYVKWVAEYVKPYIDAHFRTKPEREHTGMGGSSMGGLITIYAGLIYPHVFGKLMVFSPSLWITQTIYFDVIRFRPPLSTKIYLYAGAKESSTMIDNIRKFQSAIQSSGHSVENIQIKTNIDPKGIHNEKRWGKEFIPAINWLYY